MHGIRRYAAGLRRLGVRPGRVVSLWLPNRWQVLALMLATWKLGAVVAPVAPTIGVRELERMLARLRPAVCVTADEFAGVPHAELLRQATARLPGPAHQVVMGKRGEGQLDFGEQFEVSTSEEVPGDEVDPDRASLVLFTAGISVLGALPLLTGASALILEQWDPVAAAKLMAAENTTYMAAAPAFTEGLLQALVSLGIRLPSLRHLYSIAAPPPEGTGEQGAAAARNSVARDLGHDRGWRYVHPARRPRGHRGPQCRPPRCGAGGPAGR
jgi:cyclohexanecarboxylate-CoA ligase